MCTLLLRLAAPVQAWGLDSKFEVRQTEREPTRSGVLGLIASAMGIRRDDEEGLARLQSLNFGVRVEQEGKLLRDYHIAQQYETIDKKEDKGKSGIIKLDENNMPSINHTNTTQRYYLCDAVFLAALSGEDALIEEIATAIAHPAFPLYLGRRSCPPTLPLLLGISDAPLERALAETPWQASEWYKQDWQRRHHGESVNLRCMTDAKPGDTSRALRRDVPASWAQTNRKYAYRNAAAGMVQISQIATEHDAMAEVEACTSVE